MLGQHGPQGRYRYGNTNGCKKDATARGAFWARRSFKGGGGVARRRAQAILAVMCVKKLTQKVFSSSFFGTRE